MAKYIVTLTSAPNKLSGKKPATTLKKAKALARSFLGVARLAPSWLGSGGSDAAMLLDGPLSVRFAHGAETSTARTSPV